MKGMRGNNATFSPIPATFSSDMRSLALDADDSTSSSSSSHSLTIEMPPEDKAELRRMAMLRERQSELGPMATAGALHMYKHQPFLSGLVCGLLACAVLGLLPVLVLIGTLAQGSEAGSAAPVQAASDPWAVYTVSAPADAGVVATDNALCSKVGVSLLQRGGNAVDAAVGAALCLGVLSPASSGLGGGCYIVWHNATTGRTRFIDSRETAGSAAFPTMFARDPQAAQDGGLAVGVLAELHGLHRLWGEGASGRLAWRDVVQPASSLARRWQVSGELAAHIESVAAYLHSGKYPELSRLYLRGNGELKQEGDVVENPALAETLRRVGEDGPAYLYETQAEALAAEVRAAGGTLTAADIRGYASREEAPVSAEVMGHRVATAGGSSSGGAVVAGLLGLLGGYAAPLASTGADLYAHRLAEASKHVFALRLNLGDPSFVNCSAAIAALLSAPFLSSLRAATRDDDVLPLRAYGGAFNVDRPGAGRLPEDHGTTHLSVLDKWGHAVALTSTVNTIFGSKVVSRSTGIVFNNQMDDFSVPGAANYFGLHPSPLNYPEPRKRPLSSMSPCIVFRRTEGGGEAVRVVGGASGGPRIITATAQVLLNLLGKGMGLAEAVRAPRLHSQLLPDTVFVEDQTLVQSVGGPAGLRIQAGDDVTEALRARGHNTTDCTGSMGVAQFVAVDPDSGRRWAASDPRKGGQPAREEQP